MATKNDNNIIALEDYKKAQVLYNISRKMGNDPNLMSLVKYFERKRERKQQEAWSQPDSQEAHRG